MSLSLAQIRRFQGSERVAQLRRLQQTIPPGQQRNFMARGPDSPTKWIAMFETRKIWVPQRVRKRFRRFKPWVQFLSRSLQIR